MKKGNFAEATRLIAGGGTRNVEIDIMRGIGIELMVLGHCRFPLKSYIYLFHMAVFFMLSGYCWNPEKARNSKTVINYIKTKARTLYLPYVVANVIFILLNNIFIYLNIYTINPEFLEWADNEYTGGLAVWMSGRQIGKEVLKAIFLVRSSQLGGATWFLRSLLLISISYCLLEYLVLQKLTKNNKRIVLLFLFALCCILAECINRGIITISVGAINQCILGYVTYILGIFIRNEENRIKPKDFYNWISFIVATLLLIVMNQIGDIDIGMSLYPNILFLIIASFAGWIFIKCLAKWIKSRVSLIGKVLSYMGRNTMSIIILHFLAFKIVTFVFVVMNGLPLYVVAYFPALSTYQWLWIPYGLCGVIIPLLLNALYLKFKKVILRRYGS